MLRLFYSRVAGAAAGGVFFYGLVAGLAGDRTLGLTVAAGVAVVILVVAQRAVAGTVRAVSQQIYGDAAERQG